MTTIVDNYIVRASTPTPPLYPYLDLRRSGAKTTDYTLKKIVLAALYHTKVLIEYYIVPIVLYARKRSDTNTSPTRFIVNGDTEVRVRILV